MAYSEDAIHSVKRRGFSYSIDCLDELGIVEENGVRLIYDRMNDSLRVERTRPTLETIKQDLEEVIGE
jgi:hypothetical protein